MEKGGGGSFAQANILACVHSLPQGSTPGPTWGIWEGKGYLPLGRGNSGDCFRIDELGGVTLERGVAEWQNLAPSTKTRD